MRAVTTTAAVIAALFLVLVFGGVSLVAEPRSSGPSTITAEQRTSAVSVGTDPTEPGVYRHAGKRFVVRFPREWRIIRSLEDSEVKYAFTPETGTADARNLRVSLEVSLLAADKGSIVAGRDSVSLLKHLMPLVRHGEPGLVQDDAIAPSRLGNLEAATVRFTGTLKDRKGEFTLRAYLAEEGQLLFLVAAMAPKAEFEKTRAAFERILAQSHFGREPAARPDQSMEARQIVRKYKESVVSIVSMTEGDGATGTGFIISKSGYVLTNHHVIWNNDTNKPHTEFFVEWDESLKKNRVPARLVSHRFKPSTGKFYQMWGVDIALLQIPAGNYEPMPLTPLVDVEVGDPIVTLGFPSRGLLEGVSLTVTTGVVTRFNRGPTGATESIYTDAPFTHGSSGGPSVSLVTGGVIGQNTFGADVGSVGEGRSLNDLLDYQGVVPIDQAIQEWPTVTELGISYGGDELDFLDAYALSRLYMARGSLNAAESLAGSAAKQQYQNADAHSQWGNVALLKGFEVLRTQGEDAARKLVPDVVQHFTDALERDPKHEESLTSLAALYLQLGQFAEATAFADRAIGAAPESYQPYVIRARVAMEQKRWDEALRFADRGKAASHDVVPDAYVIAGMTKYAAGNLEAGRADYVKASAIHPSSLDARLGVAQYFVLKEQTQEALGEFQRILKDFPDNPLVYARIGDHLFNVKRFEQAVQFLDMSIVRYVKLGETPAEELFIELGSALVQLKKIDDAIRAYVAGLSHHPDGTYAHQINLQAGALNIAAERPGVGSGHVRWAQALGTSDELKEFLARFKPTRMSLDDIKTLMKLRYPESIAAQLIVLSPLDFVLRSDDDIKRLFEVERIPPSLIQAIVISQQQQRQAAGGDEREVRSPAQTNPLVGTWVAQGMTPQGMMWGMVVQFTADGRFASQNLINNSPVGATQGTYRIAGQNIVGQNAQGATFTYAYQIEGDTLVMNMPDAGGPVRFQRRRDGEPATDGEGSDPDQRVSQARDSVIHLKRFEVLDLNGFARPVPVAMLLAPADWRLEGGVRWTQGWRCMIDMIRADARLVSPDGRLAFQIFPAYVAEWQDDPTARNLAAQVQASGGFVCPLKPPFTAEQFITGLLIPASRPGAEVVDRTPAPEVAKAYVAQYGTQLSGGALNTRLTADASRVRIRYGQSEEWLFATVAVLTKPALSPSAAVQGVMAWQNAYSTSADRVYAFRAPVGELDRYEPLASVIVGSIRLNQAWQSAVQQVYINIARTIQKGIADRAAIVRQAQNEIADMQMQTWQSRQASQDRIMANWSQTMRGTETYVDPSSGTPVELPAHFDTVWTNSLGEYALVLTPGVNPNQVLSGTWTRMQKKR